jgi:hypothetical protein
MSQRAERLDRLLAIRKLNEDLNRNALKLALTAVAEVEAGLARQEAALSDSRLAARIALCEGDRREWLLADAQGEVAGWNRRRLQALLDARTTAASEARTRFLESRVEHEQIRQLVEDSRQAKRSEEDRRAQAAADDWFLAKLSRNQQGEL